MKKSKIRKVTDLLNQQELGNGFLPSHVPGIPLPAFMKKYSEALVRLPAYFSVNRPGVRSWLDANFSEFSHDVLNQLSASNKQIKSEALTVLSILIQSYRWQHCPPESEEYERTKIVFPQGLYVPWKYLCDFFSIPLSNCYYFIIASNWTLSNKKPGVSYCFDDIDRQNLKILYNWLEPPYAEQLEHFLLSFIELELFAPQIIQSIVYAYDAIEKKDISFLRTSLLQIHALIAEMSKSFGQRIRQKNIRITDWKEIIHIPFGWGISGLEGASGMQVGSIALLNTFLEIPSISPLAKATLESRKYLLPKQRLLLEALDDIHIVRDFVHNSNDKALIMLYNKCLIALSGWRTNHQKRGYLYLSHKSNKPQMATGLTLEGLETGIAEIFHQEMQTRIDETLGVMIDEH